MNRFRLMDKDSGPKSRPVADASNPLLEVEDLSIYFQGEAGEVCAVRDVSFTLAEREIVGLVGESGSGKSVTGLALLSLLPSESARVTGRAMLGGKDLLSATPSQLRKIRGNEISMVFQDPLTALDPVFSIGRQISETIRTHRAVSKASAKRQAIELLASVGIPEPEKRFRDYPHQLSGGMQQRVMIAIALACEPKLLIADEPTTALDVTIQAQILDLLRDICEDHGTAVMLISHDLGVVSELCSRVMTMYAGEIVEESTVDEALENPQHPYTSGLIQAIPSTNLGQRRLLSIPGRVPALEDMPSGCHFSPRCGYVERHCRDFHPALEPARNGRIVRCFRADELRLSGAVKNEPASATTRANT